MGERLNTQEIFFILPAGFVTSLLWPMAIWALMVSTNNI
jgi:hypothetical protein